MTHVTIHNNPSISLRRREQYQPAKGRGIVMPTNKTTTIQARITKEEKRLLKQYAESQNQTLSEFMRRTMTAVLHIIIEQQQRKQ